MKLKYGVMNNKDLAQWFGVQERTFVKAKKKKLMELQNYAKFVEQKGKINILEIYDEDYEKSGAKVLRLIEEHFREFWDMETAGVNTCSNMAQYINEYLINNNINLELSTIEKYVGKIRNKLYGKPENNEYGVEGMLGRSKYIWCKKMSDEHYQLFTEEEEDIKNNIFSKYYYTPKDKEEINKITLAISNYILGKASKDSVGKELLDIVLQKESFPNILKEIAEACGCESVVRGTVLEDKIVFEDGSYIDI